MIIRSTNVIFPFHSCLQLFEQKWYKMETTVGRTNVYIKINNICKPEKYSCLIDNFTYIAAIARANQPEALPMK